MAENTGLLFRRLRENQVSRGDVFLWGSRLLLFGSHRHQAGYQRIDGRAVGRCQLLYQEKNISVRARYIYNNYLYVLLPISMFILFNWMLGLL